jgi:hypothetical protein
MSKCLQHSLLNGHKKNRWKVASSLFCELRTVVAAALQSVFLSSQNGYDFIGMRQRTNWSTSPS